VAARAVADDLGVSLPTAYHLLNTLASEGLLAKARDGRFVLGPVCGVIADAAARDLGVPEPWVGALRKLVATTGESGYLSAFRGDELKVLYAIEGTHLLRVTGMAVGYARNLHARTSGRLLLAFASNEARLQHLGTGRLRALTPNTITSRRRLEEEFAHIRRRHLAVGRDDYVDGMTSASVPIMEAGVVVAAVTIGVPSIRYAARERALLDALRRCAQSINSR
jgi:DNA-binding IclR family transcriptional regulator